MASSDAAPARELAPVRLNFPAIEAALRSAVREPGGMREPVEEIQLRNMLAGYEHVEILVARHVDAFVRGSVGELLELNRRVLCGTDAERRAKYAGHFEATERRFYEEEGAGIGDLVESYALDMGRPVWDRAAGVYASILCKPQLFIEGNHRTGALAASCVLMAGGEPPFVLDAANARAYFAASEPLLDLRRNGFEALLRLRRLRRCLAELFASSSRPEFLARG